MMIHGTDPAIGSKLATAIGNVGAVMMGQGIPPGTSLEGYGRILANKRAFAADIRAVVAKHAGVESYFAQVLAWQKFYKDTFGIEIDLTQVKIPIRARGFNALGILAQGVDRAALIAKLQESIPVSVWDRVVLSHFVSSRNSIQGSYAFFMRGDQWHDRKWSNHSAEGLENRGVIGCTLEEWLLMALRYNQEHRHLDGWAQHNLDTGGVTLCPSTKNSEGTVLSANIHSCSSVAILARGRRYRESSIGTREVILYREQ